MTVAIKVLNELKRTELSAGAVNATRLNNINILLGRNGSGKSRFLRAIDLGIGKDAAFAARYISPERAGVFRRDGNVMNSMESSPAWLPEVRRKNQAENFKAASANLLRDIETAYLRRLQDTPSIRDDSARNFRVDSLDKINRLLSNVSIVQQGSDFVFNDSTGQVVAPDQISSGESEAVALASEMLYFFENMRKDKFNVLLLDEPDVHLHPDLQARLANFLIGLVEDLPAESQNNVTVLIATHSTPLVCALAASDRASIGTKEFGIDAVAFSAFTQQLRKVAPFFGHPLSLSLSHDVMLILEGEDDERVWQQAGRSAKGRLKLFPVVATSVSQQSELENFCAPLLKSLYDTPIAYSLRDGDGVVEELASVGPVLRFRLRCYAIENALVTEESLVVLGKTWDEFKIAADAWLTDNETHKDREQIRALIASGHRLQNVKIKSIRQLICAIAGTTKPWEVVLGQAIGSLDPVSMPTGPFNLATFLGVEATRALLRTGTAS
ncbi:MAG: hypothetical protein QOK24_1571 [Verrucomicrobiota bacterium]|jgi:predicted ATPase